MDRLTILDGASRVGTDLATRAGARFSILYFLLTSSTQYILTTLLRNVVRMYFVLANYSTVVTSTVISVRYMLLRNSRNLI